MPYCPECGGEMQYMISTKHYVCKSCGLSVTQQELIELREKLRPKSETQRIPEMVAQQEEVANSSAAFERSISR
jgi:tRNA(Ile2) C34 agmatinyltransferase TiaS